MPLPQPPNGTPGAYRPGDAVEVTLHVVPATEGVTGLVVDLCPWGEVDRLPPERSLAAQLGVFVGSPIQVVSPLGSPTAIGVIPKVRRFVVTGLFREFEDASHPVAAPPTA